MKAKKNRAPVVETCCECGATRPERQMVPFATYVDGEVGWTCPACWVTVGYDAHFSDDYRVEVMAWLSGR